MQTGFDGAAAAASPPAVPFPPATTRVPLPNGRVVATNIYGSAALHPNDLPELKKLGVKTVISFCMPGELGFDEKKMFEDAGFRFVNIAMPDGKVPNSRPDDPHGAVGQFIQAISDPASRPLAIHCAHGEGRTNVFGVLARALELQAQHQPQPFEQAVKEAKHFGFAKLFSGNQVHYARDAWSAIQRGAFGPLPGGA